MENKFVLIKTDVEEAYMNKVEWEPHIKELTKINVLWQISEEEIRESADMSVVLSLDNSHSLDMHTIITKPVPYMRILPTAAGMHQIK